MKIFSWMQNKLSGSQRFSIPNTIPAKNHLVRETCKEEFSDWPSGLLAIGTFGNNNLKEPEHSKVSGDIPPIEDDHQHAEEITHEELRQLQKELQQVSNTYSDLAEESPKHNLPPEKFFDFLKTLEDDRSTSELISNNLASEEGHHQGSTNAVLNKWKDDHLHTKNNISKKSLTFLIRKAFHCLGKFKLSPQLGDPLREMKLEKSRLEKILRAILKKKVYPQSSSPQATINKSLDQKHQSVSDSDDEAPEERSEGSSKWVKTDSDFIVLEI